MYIYLRAITSANLSGNSARRRVFKLRLPIFGAPIIYMY